MTIFIGDVKLDDYVDAVDESLFFHSTTPKRVYEEVTIPGRDGVLHLDQKRFEPYTLSIPVYFRHDFKDRYRRLLNFLNSLVGTVKLRCTPAPALWGEGHYDGIFYGAIPAPDTGAWVHSGTVTLQFQCNPRWWWDIGNVPTARSLFVTKSSNSGHYRTANFTYHTGDTIAINCLFADPGDTEDTVCIIRFQTDGRTDVSVHNIESAKSAWLSGGYYDLAPHLTNGDVFYLELDDINEWTILSDIPAGVEETYPLLQAHKVYNETPFTAQPLFEITATNDNESGSATFMMQFMLNGIIVRVLRTYASEHSGRPLYIDCETQDCYYIDSNGVSQNANAYVQMYKNSTSNPTSDFPVLKPGTNTYREAVGANVYFFPMSTVRFYPRWYLI